LKKGFSADVVVIDPGSKWIVNPEQFESKSVNSPLAGVELTGRVVTTIYQGETVFDLSDVVASAGAKQ
jgi:dihydroorotase